MNLLHQLHRHAADRPDQLALRECCSGKTLSYGQLARAVSEFARKLSSKPGSSNTYLLKCGNRLEFPIAFLACLSAGHNIFPMPPDTVDAELNQAAARCNAAAIIYDNLSIHPGITSSCATPACSEQGRTGEERGGDNTEAMQNDECRMQNEDRMPGLNSSFIIPHSAFDESPLPGYQGREQDAAFGKDEKWPSNLNTGGDGNSLATRNSQLATSPSLLLQSSGTTGLPKIVCRPAPAIDNAARQIIDSVGISPCDHILMCMPLSHSYGIEHGLLAAIAAGATVHLGQGFDVGIIGRELAKSQITILPAVPAVFEMLTQFADLPAHFPHLRLAYSAGAPLPVDLNETFYRRFGSRIGQIYGASEIGSVTFSDPTAKDFDPLSVGKPMPGVELSLDDTSQLLVRAGSLMHGYLDADVPFTADGFFPTGDLARIETDGRLILTGRLKLLMDIGGRKVNPLEVEQTLRQHPKVADCVVVGIQQTQTLRRLKALVVPTDSISCPSPEELRQFLRTRLSPYKIPRVFECRPSFPRSPAGKILRHLLEQS